MPDVFITLEEAAAFEGITYEAMKKRVQRSPEQHNVKSQAREGGGKDQVLISTSSLSAKARKAWRAAQKVEGSEVIIDKRAQEAVPWYVTADLNQYTEANKKRFYEAVELAARRVPRVGAAHRRTRCLRQGRQGFSQRQELGEHR